MLNRIVIINSELYAKASICIANNASIQITAENNVGKSSFLNSLNFLYITDKDQMRFEDNRRLSESMKHYFGGSSLHSFIIFEIFKNGYYCILVKATPENTIEYYKINGQYKESFFIETSQEGFKPRKWQTILQELTSYNPIDPPVLLKNDELYNLVYNSDKNKNPVVWLKREVKRKGNAFSNSFTDVYKHLIRTSEINEKSFKNALLIADNRQNTSLNIFSTSSFEKVQEFENKKEKLNNLIAIKSDFEKLKMLNDTFISEEIVLGKLKNTYIKKFSAVEKDLSEQTAPDSSLSTSIAVLERKINNLLKDERDKLITERADVNSEIRTAKNTLDEINQKLKEVQDYEPEPDNLLFQGLVAKAEEEITQRIDLEANFSQLERSKFTFNEIQSTLDNLKTELQTWNIL